MIKKYIAVISANLLLKIAFNSSLFGAHALTTRTYGEPSNAGEKIILVNNIEPPEHDSIQPGDYIEIQEDSDGVNVANEKYENEQDVELQSLDKSIRIEEQRGIQKEEEKEIELEKEKENDHDHSDKDEENHSDGEDNDDKFSGEYIVQEVNENGIVIQENINSIDELEDLLDFYRSLYSILFVEFETTKTYLNKIINCATDEQKNELLEDHIGILQEMYENYKKSDNSGLPSELRDSMALRISDRLRDFCFTESITDSYMETLKSIFALELEVFKGLFCYVKDKSTYNEKKTVINDLELIRFYHEELLTENGLYLTDEQLDNAAMRVSNFVNDMYFLCFSNYEDMTIFRQIRDEAIRYFDL
ncbi:hypothetical protein C922_02873 [Plasmodium inui San Antonio 1]|uniref:Uncharacterized protein n=1 Tax=Plasmodium inui San Antonio 1 TaxID=1237626 RepID=W7A102_9APIC|nr:hypothetical protein C922_02873 [Plasmodium inui San Antonio 1]EUD66887.1 hypothetical protein C922_02873 [Plasmodium inui San Antonio 1]